MIVLMAFLLMIFMAVLMDNIFWIMLMSMP